MSGLEELGLSQLKELERQYAEAQKEASRRLSLVRREIKKRNKQARKQLEGTL